jgi:hypothetical protein
MKLPLARRYRKHRTRGQALVEMAIILPVLILLLVMAIDFGRVFFGWVALQNAVRIGADLAAQSHTSWPPADNTETENLALTRYQELITQDLQAANCAFTTPHEDPTFTDLDSDGQIEYGDLATVEIACSFPLITPLAEGIFGGPVQMVASSTFTVNGVVVRGIPDPPAPADPCGSSPNASFETDPAPTTGGRVNDESSSAGSPANPFVVDFMANAESTEFCTLTYEWEIDGSSVGTDQDLLDEEFTDPAGGSHTDYEVTLTVTSSPAGGTSSESITVRVRNP